MIDLLNMIYQNKISDEEAQQILDRTVCAFHAEKLKTDIPSELMLDHYEWTAICQGIDLNVLAKWRAEGWLGQCSLCKRDLDYKDYGWVIKSNQLCHAKCLSENRAEI